MVFGNVGRFANLQADLQPTLDATTSALAASQGLTVVGGGSMPASYVSGGLRVEVPTNSRVMPYILGGLGVAHLSPTAQFTFSSGIMPDGSTPTLGTDVTTALTTAGSYTAPAASNALMLTLGGGVQFPVAPHWVVATGTVPPVTTVDVGSQVSGIVHRPTWPGSGRPRTTRGPGSTVRPSWRDTSW